MFQNCYLFSHKYTLYHSAKRDFLQNAFSFEIRYLHDTLMRTVLIIDHHLAVRGSKEDGYSDDDRAIMTVITMTRKYDDRQT